MIYIYIPVLSNLSPRTPTDMDAWPATSLLRHVSASTRRHLCTAFRSNAAHEIYNMRWVEVR